MTKLIIASVILVTSIAAAYAHSGRTASDGCHYDRKTMIRHCH